MMKNLECKKKTKKESKKYIYFIFIQYNVLFHVYNKRRHPFLSILSPQKHRYSKGPIHRSSYLVNAYMPGKKHVKIHSLGK